MEVSFIGGWNRSTWRKPPTCLKSLTNFITLYREHLIWVGLKLTTLVKIGTDCIGSCKSNYHTITTTTSPACQKIVWTDNVLIKSYLYNCVMKWLFHNLFLKPYWSLTSSAVYKLPLILSICFPKRLCWSFIAYEGLSNVFPCKY